MRTFEPLSEDKRDVGQKIAMIAAAITGVMSLIALGSGAWFMAAIEIASMLTAVWAWTALRKEDASPIAPIFVFIVVGANVAYSAFETGGTSSVTVGWLPILVIGSYAVGGRIAGLVVAIFSLIAGVLLFVFDLNGLLPPAGETPPATGLVGMSLMVTAAMGILYVFERSERREFERTLAAKREVERVNADLEQALSEVAELESQLVETERHGSLQRLAGHFAHDFNNLLTGIMAEVDLAAYTTNDPELRDGLENALNSAKKAADLTKSMLTYSGHRTKRMASTNAGELFTDIQKLAVLSTRHGVEFEVQDSTTGKTFRGDVSQLEQALLNLVLNGAQASNEDVPKVRLSAEVRELADETVGAGGTKLGPGQVIRLEVSDFGGGVPEELRAAIFEPYFTTKDTGRGLGLSSVVGIVRAHKGLLSLETNDEQTSFAISLPTEVADS